MVRLLIQCCPSYPSKLVDLNSSKYIFFDLDFTDLDSI